MQHAIQVSGLVKSYGSVRALDGISFSVAPGTVFGLLGPNGAGKSTTVRILTTLARADAGSAEITGLDVRRDAAKVRRAIGVVGQSSGADIQATARENLRLQGQLYGLAGGELERRVSSLLERFGLAQDHDRLVRTFSGGMQRRLDIALSLVNAPRVLFLDEPTTGLDPEIRTEMWDEIRQLVQGGVTVLLTTHYLEEADALASRLAIVDRGAVVAEGTPEALKRDLRGDAIHVELDDRAGIDGLPGELERVVGVREVQVNGSGLHARADDGARSVPAVLHVLEERGVRVASVTVARPSLDDVYLRHAGRTFSAAEADSENHELKEESR